MRYINSRFTYLHTYLTSSSACTPTPHQTHHPHSHDHPSGVRIPHAKFGWDALKDVAVHKEQRTDRQIPIIITHNNTVSYMTSGQIICQRPHRIPSPLPRGMGSPTDTMLRGSPKVSIPKRMSTLSAVFVQPACVTDRPTFRRRYHRPQ